MGTLVIRNVPDRLHAQLKRQALRNRRSLTQEAIQIIEIAVSNVSAAERQPVKLPPLFRLKGNRVLTIDEIEAGIAEGQR